MNANTLPEGYVLQSGGSRYEIVRVLGAGGFGITYLAKTTAMIGNIPVTYNVAIKEFFLSADCERASDGHTVAYSAPSAQRVESSCRAFVSEAKRLESIAGAHPNIVRVNDVLNANGTSYYVMEFLYGQTLGETVRKNGRMGQSEMLRLMRPVVEAAAYLHTMRITHLDIKPDNIMLSRDSDGNERVVLIDFGLSKHYNDDGSATSTIGAQGVSNGYAPLEQYTGITDFSPTSDVYSLAATMMFCLCGKPLPVAAEVNAEVIERMLPAGVSPWLRRLLISSLSMRRADRPADGRRMLDLLQNTADGDETLAPEADVAADDDTVVAEAAAGDADADATIVGSPEAAQSGETMVAADRPDIPRVSPLRFASGNQKNPLPRPRPAHVPRKPLQDESSDTSGKGRGWLMILLTLLGVGIVGASVFYLIENYAPRGSNEQVEEVADEIQEYRGTEPSTEVSDTRKASEAAVEEVAEVAATAYDLAFHDLRGPVRSVNNEYGQLFYFNRDGSWSNDTYEDRLTNRSWAKDYDGRRTTEYYSDENGSGEMVYSWNADGSISSIRDDHRQYTTYYYYNDSGERTSAYVDYDSETGKKDLSITYSNYKYDHHNNWISRKANSVNNSRVIQYWDE